MRSKPQRQTPREPPRSRSGAPAASRLPSLQRHHGPPAPASDDGLRLRTLVDASMDALLPDTPAAARDRLAQFAAMLARHGRSTNLVGPGDSAVILSDLVLEAVHLAKLLPPTGRFIDVGSGAGLPGIPLLLLLPGWSGLLVEPRLSRSAFLAAARRELALGDRMRIARGRLEQGALRSDDTSPSPHIFDLATSRAVFPPGRCLAELGPLCDSGGMVAIWGDASADSFRTGDNEQCAWESIGRETWMGPSSPRTLSLFRKR